MSAAESLRESQVTTHDLGPMIDRAHGKLLEQLRSKVRTLTPEERVQYQAELHARDAARPAPTAPQKKSMVFPWEQRRRKPAPSAPRLGQVRRRGATPEPTLEAAVPSPAPQPATSAPKQPKPRKNAAHRITCVTCGKVFIYSRSGRGALPKTCSAKCRTRYRNRISVELKRSKRTRHLPLDARILAWAARQSEVLAADAEIAFFSERPMRVRATITALVRRGKLKRIGVGMYQAVRRKEAR